MLRKFADLIHENRELLYKVMAHHTHVKGSTNSGAKLDSMCMGKPVSQVAEDVEEGRNIINYFSGLVEIAGGSASLNSPDHLNLMIRQPFGVVAAIVPWNFPTMLVRTFSNIARRTQSAHEFFFRHAMR